MSVNNSLDSVLVVLYFYKFSLHEREILSYMYEHETRNSLIPTWTKIIVYNRLNCAIMLRIILWIWLQTIIIDATRAWKPWYSDNYTHQQLLGQRNPFAIKRNLKRNLREIPPHQMGAVGVCLKMEN